MENQLDLFSKFELDPDLRQWEYDDDGSKIWKPEAGFGMKTTYTPPPVAE